MSKITLYADSGFQGSSLTLEDADSDLVHDGFKDKVSSCIVHEGEWILYVDKHYTGINITLKPGDYPNLSELMPKDSLSSLRPLPDNGLILFQDHKFEGRMVIFNDADPDLHGMDFNDKASSAIVKGSDWDLFKDVNYHGKSWRLSEGSYPESSKFFEADAVSSVRPL